jgi:hypothetical protein
MTHPADTIPPTSELRASLAETLARVQILRDLIRVAERRDRQRTGKSAVPSVAQSEGTHAPR